MFNNISIIITIHVVIGCFWYCFNIIFKRVESKIGLQRDGPLVVLITVKAGS